MARQRGKESTAHTTPGGRSTPPEAREGGAESGPGGGVPDLVRRAFSLGFSGFFTTEEAVRKALGDTLPKDWIDFAVDQSGRAREDFLERVSTEIGRSMADVDLAAVLGQLLEGRTVEVTARIKLGPADDERASGVNIRIEDERKR